MRKAIFIALIFLFGCQQKPKDPIQKYGFCKGVVIVETIKEGVLYDSPMIVSEWTMKRFNLKQNCRVDSIGMMKLIKSDLELTQIMINELR